MRVCWLVPGVPAPGNESFYPFLGREATELHETGRVDLLVVTEDQLDRPDGSGIRTVSLERPSGRAAQARAVFDGARAGSWRMAPSMSRPRRAYPLLWRIGTLVRLMRAFDPHVVHSHFAVPMGSAGVSVARSAKAASVVSLRGVDVLTDRSLGHGLRLDPDFDSELRRALPQTDICIASTEKMRSLAVGLGARSDRTVVVPNSVSPPESTAGSRVERPPGASTVVFSAGRLVELKGFDRGVRALAEMPADSHYVIAGEGPARRPLLDLAAELGIGDRVHLLGELSPDEVAQWTHEADCVWMLSRVEAFGNVVLEAYAAGAPIVATAEGIAPDLLATDSQSALLADPDDATELASLTAGVVKASPATDRVHRIEAFSGTGRSEVVLELYRRAVESREVGSS